MRTRDGGEIFRPVFRSNRKGPACPTPPAPHLPAHPPRPSRNSAAPPLADERRKQAFVAGLQRDLNRFLSVLGAPTRLAVDGEWDDATEAAFQDVCRVLGIAPERNVRTFRLIAGAAAEPTAEELQRRATDGAAFAAELRARFAQERETGAAGPLGGIAAAARAGQARVSSRRSSVTSTPTCAACTPASSWPSTASGTSTPSTRSSRSARCSGSRPSGRRGRSGSSPARPPRAPRRARRARTHRRRRGRGQAEGTPASPPRIVLGGRSLPKDERDARLRRVRAAHPQRPPACGSARRRARASTASGARTPNARSRDLQGARASRPSATCVPTGSSPARSRRAPRRRPKRASTAGVAYESACARCSPTSAGRCRAPPPKPKPPDSPTAKPGPPHRRRRRRDARAAIRAHGGRYEQEILAASRGHEGPGRTAVRDDRDTSPASRTSSAATRCRTRSRAAPAAVPVGHQGALPAVPRNRDEGRGARASARCS